MTKSNINVNDLFAFDPEIETTLHAARRARMLTYSRITELDPISEHTDFNCSSSFNRVDFTSSSDSLVNSEIMDNKSLKQLAELDVENYQPLCIRYPDLSIAFELKSGLIHLLPKFHGLAGGDPHKHLKEFHVVCSTMKPQGVDEEQIKMRAFPFSLDGGAKDWFYYLQPSSIGSWNDMARHFLEKFVPSSRATSIRKEISGIRQANEENLHEYSEQFQRLCASCPHHQIPDQLLIVYFYKGLLPMDRNLLDAASGGVLVNKTRVAAKELIAEMAANAQQFGTRANNSVVFQVQESTVQSSAAPTVASSMENQGIENKLDELNSLVRQLAVTQIVQPPTPDEQPVWHLLIPLVDQTVAAVGVFLGKSQYQQQQYNPFSNTYNLGWEDHPNLKWNQNLNQQSLPPYQQRQNIQHAVPPHQLQQETLAQQQSNCGPSLEDLVKLMTTSNLQFQQRTESTIQNLQTRIGKLATSMSQVQPQNSSSFLPSQTVPNPKGNANVSAISLKSGKQLNEPQQATVEDELALEKNKTAQEKKKFDNELEFSVPLPFPQRAINSKKLAEIAQEKEMLDTFRKVEVNIPLLDAFNQIPKYSKFLKELWINKSCIFDDCMLDLGASINVMPESVYKSLGLGPLCATGVVIQLANRSNAHPSGLIENVLVRLNNLIFPTDFYILDMEGESPSSKPPIILGMPFL
ncbi:uncharacterized protein LOC133298627 [Gastrolobium bilobum]|uniref:uncharacterized protein LOC133298627 n=1 Tax=Gastrolobium bilobum TaxID=150636 RepID=UPI002AB187BE|nr:uncharacterized protein LOC133298627 [Gastrolobium bilobum]